MFSRKGLLIAIIATACAASPSKPVAPWRVELATSGGIAGRGIGSAAIDSQGNVSVTTMARKTCASHATSDELANIERLLGMSKPAKWGSYVPENPCCDRIEYTLTFEEGDKKYGARWIDDPLPRPADLVKVADAMSALRQKYSEQCK